MMMAPIRPNEVSKSEYETLAALRTGIRRFLRYTEGQARRKGLSPQQHQLLLAIKGRPGKDWATASELAASLQLRHNSVVGLVDRAARMGLVYRQPDPNDGRLVQIHLTPEGEAVLSELAEVHREELQRLSGDVLTLLRRLNDM
jgi:DNA-binding MarR family transcriptional regulator